MGLYSEIFSIPYIRYIQGTTQGVVNHLTLKDYHETVKAHHRHILASLDMVISPSIAYTTNTLDGQPWEHPKFIYKAIYLMPQMPNLQVIFAEFVEGALETWDRFTSEYAVGGLIDTASDEVLDSAFMPATNDANEGALGSVIQVTARNNPSLTIAHTAQLASFFRNETQTHMDRHYTPEDHRYIMAAARKLDASGIEQQRRDALVNANLEKVKMNKEKQEKTRARVEAIRNRLADTAVILKRDNLFSLGIDALNDQIDLHRQAEREANVTDCATPAKSKMTCKVYKLSALHAALTKLDGSTVVDGELGPAKVKEYMPGSVLVRENDIQEDEEMLSQ
ncbi:hypothetical protein EDD85DRAFT_964173 [Armillaria nabsnona]|nr:hypothetical protein EDD85DRAFT_964173 [Armillaria nabsnona]